MGMNRVKGGGRMPPQPKKIIQVQPAKVELKKSENAWVRPGDKAKELPEEERAKEVW